ncbi:hypothetical protein E4T50_05761 [Aureobasidium sp. EXF-12298]|nr:hypothetical protein E4T50_05761 [Aureobasidium sp. EXF-12298]KAI4765468.1 hypothetical protein E4T51_01621 [Aureobasidium sp. EXF-12344]KAI4783319.1 hypothetical protein E4T52_01784 [Aureobasidium sp. EXF-3400]
MRPALLRRTDPLSREPVVSILAEEFDSPWMPGENLARNLNIDLPMITVDGLRLLALPNEILATICADNDLSVNDLAAMRLTNKELHAVATQEFAQRYFQNPFVMMLKDSLETLVKICKHPVFGPQVRKIQLLNNFFYPGNLVFFAQEMKDAYRPTGTTRLLTRRKRLQRFIDLVADQYVLLRSGAGLKILEEAFGTLGEQGGSVAVASQEFELSSPPIGWLRIAEDLRNDRIGCILGEPEVMSTTSILLEAAQAAACSVHKLEVGVDFFKVENFREQLGLHVFDESLLLGLQEFTFHFQWQNRDRHQNLLAERHLVSLLELLPKDLKTLVVSSDAELLKDYPEAFALYEPPYMELRRDLLTTMQPTALEVIYLSRMLLYQDDLLPFLNAHRCSLKKLVLDRVYLLGDWERVLSRIADNLPSLEYFGLRKARTASEYRHPWYNGFAAKIEHWFFESVEFKNREGMCQEIKMFIELQEAEKQAKQAHEQALKQAREQRQAGRRIAKTNPPRRSKRIAENKSSENQKQEG